MVRKINRLKMYILLKVVVFSSVVVVFLGVYVNVHVSYLTYGIFNFPYQYIHIHHHTVI